MPVNNWEQALEQKETCVYWLPFDRLFLARVIFVFVLLLFWMVVGWFEWPLKLLGGMQFKRPKRVPPSPIVMTERSRPEPFPLQLRTKLSDGDTTHKSSCITTGFRRGSVKCISSSAPRPSIGLDRIEWRPATTPAFVDFDRHYVIRPRSARSNTAAAVVVIVIWWPTNSIPGSLLRHVM